jgi:hypothetical protein
MYKGLKMIVASLHKLSLSLEHDGISSDEELALNISQTMKDVRAVLCYFYVSFYLLFLRSYNFSFGKFIFI